MDRIDRLQRFLNQNYAMPVELLSPAPRGFYGETYEVRSASEKLLLKIDPWKFHQVSFLYGLKVMAELLDRGITFLPDLIRGAHGETSFTFEGAPLALFSYVEGVHTEEYPLTWLFEKLAVVYQKLPTAASGDLFTAEDFELFRALEGALRPSDSIDCGILQVLGEARSRFDQYAQRLRTSARRCRELGLPTVMTHGDAGGNCIVRDNAVTIIDWDSARPAAPERDTWMFMHRPEQTREIEAALASAGFPYKLHSEAFAYYAYSTFFSYLCQYLLEIREAAPALKAQKAAEMADFIRNGWTYGQLAAADQVRL